MNAVPGLILASSLLLTSWVDLVSPFVSDVSRWSHRGETHYREGNWEEAVRDYERAAEAAPGGIREYNRGTAAYQEGRHDDALAAFEAASAARDLDRGRLAYDTGNALFQKGDYAAARDMYRQTLRMDPTDEAARANFELAAKLAQENQQEQQQQQSEPQSGENPQDKQQQSPQNAPPDSTGENRPSPQSQEPSQEQESESSQADAEPSEPSEENAQQKEGEAAEVREMTPAEAQRLLNAVTPEERELLQTRLKAARKKRAEKDW